MQDRVEREGWRVRYGVVWYRMTYWLRGTNCSMVLHGMALRRSCRMCCVHVLDLRVKGVSREEEDILRETSVAEQVNRHFPRLIRLLEVLQSPIAQKAPEADSINRRFDVWFGVVWCGVSWEAVVRLQWLDSYGCVEMVETITRWVSGM